MHPDLAAFDRFKTRIQGLRSKTMDNGCTEAEALLAAAKVAELLDRYDLSLTDVEISTAQCEHRHYETRRKKRIPLDDCIDAIAKFCDCRVWRGTVGSGARRKGAQGGRPTRLLRISSERCVGGIWRNLREKKPSIGRSRNCPAFVRPNDSASGQRAGKAGECCCPSHKRRRFSGYLGPSRSGKRRLRVPR
jgi:hypothetical protein